VETARRAAESDVPALADLWRTAAAAARAARGGAALLAELPALDAVDDVLRSGLDAPDRVVVAGSFDDAVVGIATARVHRPVSAPHRPLAVVEVLYVDPEARGVGVGEAMMDVVLRWGEKAGCHGIDAPALPGARDAKAFFETMGMVTRALIMHRPITPGGRPGTTGRP
jgi:GNAT superfamily N-acetyltransferase